VVKAGTDMRQMEMKVANHDVWAVGGRVVVVMNIHVQLFCAHYFMMNTKKITGNLNHL
jgi:hypothetical protein